MRRRFAWLVLVMPLAAPAMTLDRPLADPAQEARARGVFHELKCVVCEGQALSESDAPLALEMRGEIRRMASEGRSREEILAYFRARYGTRVLLNPPFEPMTYLLWLAPALLLIGGFFILRRATGSAS